MSKEGDMRKLVTTVSTIQTNWTLEFSTNLLQLDYLY